METLDLLIKNGTVFDGGGGEPFEADIGIAGERIVLLDKNLKIKNQKLKKIIDAEGLAVAPGFIDTHAHSEFTLLADPHAEGKVFQGITTEINGNCGVSAAPLYEAAFEHREQDLKELGIKERWSNFNEYFNILNKKGITVNFATLAGHGNIRASVVGYENRKPDTQELLKMQSMLNASIAEGAIGLSTGLIYPPGVYSDTKELIALAKTFFEKNMIYTSHMRSEGESLIDSIKEIISIGKEAGCKVHISHIKTSGKANWSKIDEAISLIERAQQNSIKLTCDRYPYTASSTDLDAIMPSWTYEGGTDKELERLNTPAVLERIRKEVLQRHQEDDYWERVNVSSVQFENNKWMEGKTLSSIAQKLSKHPVDALFYILAAEKLRAGAIFFSMSEDNLLRFLSLPYVMIGSDSSARSSTGITCTGKPHPRGFGSFSRFLGRYVREKKIMPLNEAIRKITLLPSQVFGLRNRGRIQEGFYADIVLFDPDLINDKATFDSPFLKPEGIYYVFVNGKAAMLEGKAVQNHSGKILKSNPVD